MNSNTIRKSYVYAVSKKCFWWELRCCAWIDERTWGWQSLCNCCV